jgi:hypothetical protein
MQGKRILLLLVALWAAVALMVGWLATLWLL